MCLSSGRIVDCNASFTAFFGYAKHVLCDPQTTFLSLVHPDSLQAQLDIVVRLKAEGEKQKHLKNDNLPELVSTAYFDRPLQKFVAASGAIKHAYATSWLIRGAIEETPTANSASNSNSSSSAVKDEKNKEEKKEEKETSVVIVTVFEPSDPSTQPLSLPPPITSFPPGFAPSTNPAYGLVPVSNTPTTSPHAHSVNHAHGIASNNMNVHAHSHHAMSHQHSQHMNPNLNPHMNSHPHGHTHTSHSGHSHGHTHTHSHGGVNHMHQGHHGSHGHTHGHSHSHPHAHTLNQHTAHTHLPTTPQNLDYRYAASQQTPPSHPSNSTHHNMYNLHSPYIPSPSANSAANVRSPSDM